MVFKDTVPEIHYSSGVIAVHQTQLSGWKFCRTFLVTVKQKTISAVCLIAAAAARHASQLEFDDAAWKKKSDLTGI